MKYGLLVDFGAPYCNYGDYVQSIAIEYLYKLMNIPKNKIVHVTQKQLATYDGEQLLLPYNYVLHFLVNQSDGDVALSDKITPVFLGISVESSMLLDSYPLENFAASNKKWIKLFKKYAPIGCRDEYTCQFIKSLGISAYLQGCITNIFPKREEGNYKKILFIDCPIELLPYIPQNLVPQIEVLGNTVYNGNISVEDNYLKIKSRYKYYCDNAALVVTSRYHVATPCNAMGIPSIFIMKLFDKNSKDIRLDTLNPYLPLYTNNDYQKINWHPKWHDFQELKSNIINLAASRINDAYNQYMCQKYIYSFFEPRIKAFQNIPQDVEAIYKIKLCSFIQKNYPSPMNGGFYIWGASQLLCDGNNVALANLVSEYNKNLNFIGWIDTYKSGKLADKLIFKPYKFHVADNEFVIVTAETAVADSIKCFHGMGLSKKNFIILANDMISKDDIGRINDGRK